jgi:hypothetical protein
VIYLDFVLAWLYHRFNISYQLGKLLLAQNALEQAALSARSIVFHELTQFTPPPGIGDVISY